MTAENKNPLTRKAVGKKFGSRKCHFAMTQAFFSQMECLGAILTV
jgi:hypothetical protein